MMDKREWTFEIGHKIAQMCPTMFELGNRARVVCWNKGQNWPSNSMLLLSQGLMLWRNFTKDLFNIFKHNLGKFR